VEGGGLQAVAVVVCSPGNSGGVKRSGAFGLPARVGVNGRGSADRPGSGAERRRWNSAGEHQRGSMSLTGFKASSERGIENLAVSRDGRDQRRIPKDTSFGAGLGRREARRLARL
jgi:hypothetical protein